MTLRPRILIVDDDLGPRESLRQILKPWCEVRTAESATEALACIPTFEPDVLISDIRMPEVNGLDLLQQVKRLDPTVEVVMITAYGSVETAKLALKHGACDYLLKPFSRSDLEDVLRRALQRRSTATP